MNKHGTVDTEYSYQLFNENLILRKENEELKKKLTMLSEVFHKLILKPLGEIPEEFR